jgi:EAL domain-containing protein (putative c-di-GMP-specific phosphodiesterase class I)
MSYLKRFPIGCLKVDRSFVQGLPRSLDDAAIATAIISMAHSLRMSVVAEGVETPEQAAFLRSRGLRSACRGYLFGRPVAAAQHRTEALAATGCRICALFADAGSGSVKPCATPSGCQPLGGRAV